MFDDAVEAFCIALYIKSKFKSIVVWRCSLRLHRLFSLYAQVRASHYADNPMLQQYP